jgi:hypothetical protein
MTGMLDGYADLIDLVGQLPSIVHRFSNSMSDEFCFGR